VILGEPWHIISSTDIHHVISFRADFTGRSLTIRAGNRRTVRIKFTPEFEGRFEATLQLIFESKQLGRFAVSRSLQASAGSLEDHERFEFLDQETFVPRSGSGRQIPPEKIVPLSDTARQLGKLPEYKLPLLVQEVVDSVTSTQNYNPMARNLIATLRPSELSMDTYVEYFTALLNVEEGHQL
jgi:helicase MOV-10